MTDPVEHLFRTVELGAGGQFRALDHQHRQPEIACGNQLGLSAAATRVLADHKVDRMVAQKAGIVVNGKRPAIDDEGMMGQGRGLARRIDETQQIVVFRTGAESLHMHPAKGEHNPARRSGKGFDGACDLGRAGPVVSRCRLPCRTGERGMGNSRKTRSLQSMHAHCRGERVSGVQQMRHAMFAQVCGQSGHAPKAPDARWYGLGARVLRASGIAQHGSNAMLGQQASEGARFGGAAQQQDIRHG